MKSSRAMVSLCGYFAALLGCGGQAPSSASPVSPVDILEQQHQILFVNGQEQQVFDGYMVQAGDSLMVRAFAGPGVDLFTVVRTPTQATQQAHVPGLAERVDMVQVGDDISRVYRSGCRGAAGAVTTCEAGGERLVETLDDQGRLASRSFPTVHSTGLSISYTQHERLCGRIIPRRITLAWGQGERHMVIFTASCQQRRALPRELTR